MTRLDPPFGTQGGSPRPVLIAVAGASGGARLLASDNTKPTTARGLAGQEPAIAKGDQTVVGAQRPSGGSRLRVRPAASVVVGHGDATALDDVQARRWRLTDARISRAMHEPGPGIGSGPLVVQSGRATLAEDDARSWTNAQRRGQDDR
ncbi:MAG: hypothetical protein QOH12_1773, partial [Solirubrobacteraceae bacterium]|nr:hypothetical protein [Solirubrobacteraceae bacterium]